MSAQTDLQNALILKEHELSVRVRMALNTYDAQHPLDERTEQRPEKAFNAAAPR
ncbi:MAG: hypothetical protein IH851_08775 [Armatimonadetes bacterium]|nr:hypothetical protein [Armatimonadota bacterium]